MGITIPVSAEYQMSGGSDASLLTESGHSTIDVPRCTYCFVDGGLQ